MISPCISLCVLDPESELCEGCGRSLDEISQWSRMTDDQRRAVMSRLPERLKDLVSTST
ncbi:DUF1289 domain-containing protein [Kaistia defluvii]|uniref:DUF1289 domain-containing protein n=1 Tax=Kaistia defluvii TaxID=410841 RepID=UPI002253CC3B|nr:DUF1289 domain-containing protein [Kaistia defluvii]MCX5520341.1 DUF1289 domain-containing protein [Kaistia defluvii]